MVRARGGALPLACGLVTDSGWVGEGVSLVISGFPFHRGLSGSGLGLRGSWWRLAFSSVLGAMKIKGRAEALPLVFALLAQRKRDRPVDSPFPTVTMVARVDIECKGIRWGRGYAGTGDILGVWRSLPKAREKPRCAMCWAMRISRPLRRLRG